MSAVAARITGWLAVLSVVIASVLPGNLRPHILPNNYEEHCLAYIVVGYLLAAAYPTLRQRLVLGAMLAVGAGSLEITQLFIAGRTASVADFAASVLGACIGLCVMMIIQRLRGSVPRLFRFKYSKRRLPLAEDVVLVSRERREKVAEDPS